MADHLVLQLRDQIVTDVTGLSTTGSSVYKGRIAPIQDADLPALKIMVGESEQDEEQRSGAYPHRVVLRTEFIIRILTSTTTDPDATLFQIAKEVQVALGGDERLNDIALAAYPGSMGEPQYTDESKQKQGMLDVTWIAEWTTLMNSWEA